MIKRKPYTSIWNELSSEKSMILLAGPRQAGKTTLAEMLSEEVTNTLYFNWDLATDKRRLIDNPFFFQDIIRKDKSRPLVVFDEIHKYKEWKNYLKGVYDGFHSDFLFLVTGSGRLDYYQKGGDSLAGRYYMLHLWPLTLAELHYQNTTFKDFQANPATPCTHKPDVAQAIWKRLSRFSGFPEPYLSAKDTTYRRWSATYHRQLVREDIRDMTGITHIDDLEILFSLLPSKVGSPLSIPKLATDLRTSYNTVNNWLRIFSRFYLTFDVTPWTDQIARAIHKARKTYLFDYAAIEDPGAKFENMIALELFRAVSSWNDMGWGNFGLHYIRTKEGREVDFLVSQNRKPMFLVEAKTGNDSPAPNLLHFQRALNVPSIQLMNNGSGFKLTDHAGPPLLIAPAAYWLPSLP